jgi:hypothetical protein
MKRSRIRKIFPSDFTSFYPGYLLAEETEVVAKLSLRYEIIDLFTCGDREIETVRDTIDKEPSIIGELN